MKILYVTTIGSTMGFFNSLIRKLLDEGHTVDVATNEMEAQVPVCYREWGCKIYPLSCSRSPIKKGNNDAVFQIQKIVAEGNYDIVHCHTPIASACTRIACRKARKRGTRVIYTAHGFHFYKGAQLINWIIYYPIEKWLAKYTDVLITINKEDYERAKDHFRAKAIEYVPGVGIDLKKINSVSVDRALKRKELELPVDAFVILSVGELNKNKNHETVIRALERIDNQNIHYVICGQGVLEGTLRDLSCKLGLEGRVHFLGYRKDIIEICKISDLFVLASYREGLSVALMEAMASGLPCVVSDIRGNADLIDGNSGALFDPKHARALSNTINALMNDISKQELIGKRNIKSSKKYSHVSINYITIEIYKSYQHGKYDGESYGTII